MRISDFALGVRLLSIYESFILTSTLRNTKHEIPNPKSTVTTRASPGFRLLLSDAVDRSHAPHQRFAVDRNDLSIWKDAL